MPDAAKLNWYLANADGEVMSPRKTELGIRRAIAETLDVAHEEISLGPGDDERQVLGPDGEPTGWIAIHRSAVEEVVDPRRVIVPDDTIPP